MTGAALRNEKGFSLVEILLVTVVAGFIVLLIANLPTSLGSIGNSKKESLAKDIASQVIEDLRNKTYDNLANGTNSIADSRLSSMPGGNGSVVVEDCPVSVCTHSEAVKKVTVQIGWVESGKNRSVSVSTFIAKGGLP